MKLAVAAVLALIGTARADDDPDDRASWQAGIGIHAPGLMQVGRWNAMNLGFAGMFGVRFDRLALFGEADLGTLWSASWTRGTIRTGPDDYLGGSLLRVAVGARYVFASSTGSWSKHEQRVSHELYVDGALGEQRVSVDGADAVSRHDISLGFGYITLIRLGRDRGTFGTFYSLHLGYAPGLATPDPFMECPSCPRETGGRDIGMSFDFGVLFGG